MATNAGRILILAKGAWNSTANYTQLDLVTRGALAYLARQASVNVDPATDTSYTYWQPFGSATPIATTTTPGIVMPDGTTITVDGTGLISAALGVSDITDVVITSLADGQVLKYNSNTQVWENVSLGTAASKNSTNAVTSGSTDLVESGAVYSETQALSNKVGDLTDLDTTDKTSIVNAINEVAEGTNRAEISTMNNILGSKNMLPNNAITQTVAGATYTVNADGSITVSNSATTNNSYVDLVTNLNLPNGNYILSAENSTANVYSYVLLDGVRYNAISDEEVTFTVNNNTIDRVRLVSAKDYPGTAITLKIMIRPANITDDTYVPYAKTNKELTEYGSRLLWSGSQASGAGVNLTVKDLSKYTLVAAEFSGGATNTTCIGTLASNGVYYCGGVEFTSNASQIYVATINTGGTDIISNIGVRIGSSTTSRTLVRIVGIA